MITSDELTGSSACIRFRMSATRTDAFPFALTFGITPKENYKIISHEIIMRKSICTQIRIMLNFMFIIMMMMIFHKGTTLGFSPFLF